MFEKLSTAVKTLAPQLNMGGLTGALQTILTPELGKAIGGMVAQGIEQKQAAGAAKVLPGGAPAPAKPQIAPDIVQRVGALRIAQTPPVQIAATIDLVQTMWQGQFKAQLEPALGALMNGDVNPARQALNAVLTDARPELANGVFIDDVLRAMAVQTGMPIPPALVVPEKAPVAPPVDASVAAPLITPVPVTKFEPVVVPDAPPVEAEIEEYVEHAPMLPKKKEEVVAAPLPEHQQQLDGADASPVPALA